MCVCVCVSCSMCVQPHAWVHVPVCMFFCMHMHDRGCVRSYLCMCVHIILYCIYYVALVLNGHSQQARTCKCGWWMLNEVTVSVMRTLLQSSESLKCSPYATFVLKYWLMLGFKHESTHLTEYSNERLLGSNRQK